MSTELESLVSKLEVEVSGEPAILEASDLKYGDFVAISCKGDRYNGLVVSTQNNLLCIEGASKDVLMSRVSQAEVTWVTRLYTCKNEAEIFELRRLMLNCYENAEAHWSHERVNTKSYVTFVKWLEKKNRPVSTSWWTRLIS